MTRQRPHRRRSRKGKVFTAGRRKGDGRDHNAHLMINGRPAPDSNGFTLREGKFGMYDYYNFPGYYEPSFTWNGWLSPYFSFATSVKILNWVAKGYKDEKPGTFAWRYEEDKDRFLSFFEGESEIDEQGVDILIDGKVHHLYNIGGCMWTWERKR